MPKEAAESWATRQRANCCRANELFEEIDAIALEAYGLSEADIQSSDEVSESIHSLDAPFGSQISKRAAVADFVSYALGIAMGRWNYHNAASQKSVTTPEPFTAFSHRSPGELDGEIPDGYGITVDSDGILVDDDSHADDIVRACQTVISLFWSNAAAAEQQICETLGVKTLREYFRKPTKGGFWDDTIGRYSQGRRKAPIYLLLQSERRSFAIWIYYQRLDRDTIFKAIKNYVDPKLNLLSDELRELQARCETLKSESRDAKEVRKLERRIESVEQFLNEVESFGTKLRSVAELNLIPNLDDGVLLNVAPLHALCPWNAATKHWNDLIAGKYLWSSVSQQLNRSSERV